MAAVEQQRMLITAQNGHRVSRYEVVMPVKDSITPCPACGNSDINAWADDGEADAADWWECTRCGCSGAFLHMDTSLSTTPNGLHVGGE